MDDGIHLTLALAEIEAYAELGLRAPQAPTVDPLDPFNGVQLEVSINTGADGWGLVDGQPVSDDALQELVARGWIHAVRIGWRATQRVREVGHGERGGQA